MGAYHMFGMTPDGLSGPLCHAKSMGRTRGGNVDRDNFLLRLGKEIGEQDEQHQWTDEW